MDALAQLLAEKGHVVLDGAMGTQLFAAGLTAGDPPEGWNTDHPDRIQAIHRSYVDAGSDVVLTNTFGGNRFRLKLHDLQDRVHELNVAAAANARMAADSVDRIVLVAGSMGPTGELLSPLGVLDPDEAADGFAEQAAGLADGGVDLLWFETLSALNAVEAGIRGARSATDLPIVVTMSYDTAGRTMMGVTGTEMGERLADLGVAAMGANCGASLVDTEAAAAQIRAVNGNIPVVAKANAGIPVWRGAELSYDGTPEVLAAYAHRVRQAGVGIIGACCGSTPEHIAYISDVLDGRRPVPDVDPPVAASSNPGAGDGAARRRRRRSR